MDGYFIELFNEVDVHIGKPYNPASYGYTHFSFVVDDIQAFFERIEKGLEDIIDVKAQLNCDHTWAMWFHDPDDSRIEVHQFMRYGKAWRGAGLAVDSSLLFGRSLV